MNDDDALAVCGGAIVLAAAGLTLAGPLGMALVGAVLLAVGLTFGRDDASASGTDAAGPTRNCPDCGAVVDGDACDYCGRSLSE